VYTIKLNYCRLYYNLFVDNHVVANRCYISKIAHLERIQKAQMNFKVIQGRRK